MTPERKSELRKLCEAATAGPWVSVPVRHRLWAVRDSAPIYSDGLWVILPADDLERLPVAIVDKGDDGHAPTREHAEQESAFIAASRTAIPELLTALDAAEAKLEQVRLIIAPNEASPDIVRAAQRIIDTCFVEIEQANKVHAKNVDLSDKLRATRAQVAALAGQVADWRAGLEEIAEGRGAFSSDQLEFAVNVIEAAKARAVEMLARPTAIERKVAAGLALADSVLDLSEDGTQERFDAFDAYKAAKEAENV